MGCTMNMMQCPTCEGSKFLETDMWTKEAVSGTNGNTTYRIVPVVQQCPDCELWAAIWPFLKVAVLIPNDKAPDEFRIIDFFTPDQQDQPATSLTVKDFRRLKQFVESVANIKPAGDGDTST